MKQIHRKTLKPMMAHAFLRLAKTCNDRELQMYHAHVHLTIDWTVLDASWPQVIAQNTSRLLGFAVMYK